MGRFFLSYLPKSPRCVEKWIAKSTSVQEICFRKYFRCPSVSASLSDIKFVLEQLGNDFVVAMDRYTTRKTGYDASCRGAENAQLDLGLDRASCTAEIAVLRRVARVQYNHLVSAWEAARHFKPLEIPEDIKSEKLFPLSKLRDKLIKDIEEINNSPL